MRFWIAEPGEYHMSYSGELGGPPPPSAAAEPPRRRDASTRESKGHATDDADGEASDGHATDDAHLRRRRKVKKGTGDDATTGAGDRRHADGVDSIVQVSM